MNDLHPFKERLPYVAAIVELDEGPRLMTNMEDCEPADLQVGMPVTVGFRPITDDIHGHHLSASLGPSDGTIISRRNT